MKSKIYILGIFLVIFMFLAINISWADDSIPRSRTFGSYGYDRGKSGPGLPQKGLTHQNRAPREYEKAGRPAWADGKFTYRERHRFQNNRSQTGKGIKRRKGNYRDYTRGHINKKPKQPFIPRFSIDFPFSKPWIH